MRTALSAIPPVFRAQTGSVCAQRFQSQDRDQDRGSGFNKGGTGGGEGGSASMPVSYTRHVPKFLQAHAHLLGKGHARREEEPQLLGEAQQPEPGSDSEDDQVRPPHLARLTTRCCTVTRRPDTQMRWPGVAPASP